jgi:hypothetical protein
MACAKCDFCTPKGSSKALLLEAKDNLQRMLAAVPLTGDERAAVDDGPAALDKLLGQLTDTPTPAGPTPRQMGSRAAGRGCPKGVRADAHNWRSRRLYRATCGR